MKKKSIDGFLERGSGILLHITSLPGLSGSGTLGHEADQFVSFLSDCGQSCWQVLPLGPVSPQQGFSPYASHSAFAGNEWFISLEELAKEGLLSPGSVPRLPDADFVPFDELLPLRSRLLGEAAAAFFRRGGDKERDFVRFCESSRFWLDDYALFIALAEEAGTQHWPHWDPDLARRQPRVLAGAADRLRERIRMVQFVQYAFSRQWQHLLEHCRERGVAIMGDIPFYVTMDGADTWSHPEIFGLDPKNSEPLEVAGVPPDYFSADGQRWGNPLYLWFSGLEAKSFLRPATYEWWRSRLKRTLELVDWLRIDHFRGFAGFWAIPAAMPTAREGRWEAGPGRAFFEQLFRDLGPLPLIAEDLGVITPDVEKLRDSFAIPGMKVLQFAFDGRPDNPYLPQNYSHDRCLVYTGTHDNNTTNGWFYGGETGESTRKYVLDHLGCDNRDQFHWQMIRLALRSPARLAILPMQDILGYGSELRMNVPGRAGGNWRWKLKPGALDAEVAKKMRHLTWLYNRCAAEGGLSPNS